MNSLKNLFTKKRIIILLLISITLGFFTVEYTYKKWFDLTSTTLRILKNRENFYTYDSLGIPINNYYYYNDSIWIGSHRNPVTIAHKAISYYNSKENPEAKTKFLNCADYLVKNTFDTLNYSLHPYNFPWPSYNLKPPWYSAMAEGLSLNVFAKAYKMTGDSIYINKGKRVLNAFLIPVSKGGITIKDDTNKWWYEEYAAKDVENPRVLNGMIYNLLGLHEYYKVTGNKLAINLYNKGFNAVAENLHKYDNNGWSYYNIKGKLASIYYHKDHINLLEKLYKIRDKKILLKYKQRWEAHTKIKKDPCMYIKLLKSPNKLEIFILFLNTLLSFLLLLLIFWLYIKIRK